MTLPRPHALALLLALAPGLLAASPPDTDEDGGKGPVTFGVGVKHGIIQTIGPVLALRVPYLDIQWSGSWFGGDWYSALTEVRVEFYRDFRSTPFVATAQFLHSSDHLPLVQCSGLMVHGGYAFRGKRGNELSLALGAGRRYVPLGTEPLTIGPSGVFPSYMLAYLYHF